MNTYQISLLNERTRLTQQLKKHQQWETTKTQLQQPTTPKQRHTIIQTITKHLPRRTPTHPNPEIDQILDQLLSTNYETLPDHTFRKHIQQLIKNTQPTTHTTQQLQTRIQAINNLINAPRKTKTRWKARYQTYQNHGLSDQESAQRLITTYLQNTQNT